MSDNQLSDVRSHHGLLLRSVFGPLHTVEVQGAPRQSNIIVKQMRCGLSLRGNPRILHFSVNDGSASLPLIPTNLTERGKNDLTSHRSSGL